MRFSLQSAASLEHSLCHCKAQTAHMYMSDSQCAAINMPTSALYSLFWNSWVELRRCCFLCPERLLWCIHHSMASLSYVQPSAATTASCAKSCSHAREFDLHPP